MKIDHINIVVRDLDTAADFFADIGFEVIKRDQLEGQWIDQIVDLRGVKAEFIAMAIPGAETKLELIRYDAPAGTGDPLIGQANQIGLRHLAFEVKGIEGIVAKLKSKNVTFLSDIQVYNVTKKLCYFYGPEGILLELAEYSK
ncbi:MAG TPA: VOC family protein [Candidatus Saccharimonadia bacterium]|nr:VOC family protein [Candidatus Saccharimonadia bacterium]